MPSPEALNLSTALASNCPILWLPLWASTGYSKACVRKCVTSRISLHLEGVVQKMIYRFSKVLTFASNEDTVGFTPKWRFLSHAESVVILIAGP